MYTFFNDAGHGWLRVKISELQDLGIARQISSYSYVKGDYAYLEEDEDAGRFLVAKYGKDWSFDKLESMGVLTEQHTNNSPIRGYEHYFAAA